MRRSADIRLAVAWAAVCIGGACAPKTAVPTAAPVVAPPPSVSFVEVLAHQGLSAPTPSFGCAVHDANGDGDPDIFFGNHGKTPRLLVGGEGAEFQAQRPFVSDDLGYDGHGAAWADIDGDGRRALIHSVGAVGGTGAGPNRLYAWRKGVFRDVAAWLRVDAPEDRGRTPVWVDWNGDGALDIVLVNAERADAPSHVVVQRPGGRFVPAVDGPELVDGLTMGLVTDWNGDGHVDVGLVGASLPASVYDLSVNPPVLAEVDIGRVENVVDLVAGDFDGDLRSDLVALRRLYGARVVGRVDPSTARGAWVCRDDALGMRFQADQPVTLRVLPHRNDWVAGMGKDRAPVDLFDDVLLDPADERTWGIVDAPEGDYRSIQIGYSPTSHEWTLTTRCTGASDLLVEVLDPSATIGEPVMLGAEPDEGQPPGAHTDWMLHGTAGGFVAIPVLGLEEPSLCVSGIAGDLDNDMDLDLYLACSGGVENVPNRLLLNRGDGHFVQAPVGAGAAGPATGLADSVCSADVDQDGYLDLILTNGRYQVAGPDQLLLNQGKGKHWLELDLVGTLSNREAIGARVLVMAGGRAQLREQGGGMHHRAQNHPRIHVGLGPHEQADSVEIVWPDGSVQVLRDVAADQVLRVEQPGALAGTAGGDAAPGR